MRKGHRDPQAIREAVLLVLGCGVFLVWAITTLAATFFERPVDGQVHAIMLATVTGLLALAGVAGYKADKKNGTNGTGDKDA